MSLAMELLVEEIKGQEEINEGSIRTHQVKDGDSVTVMIGYGAMNAEDKLQIHAKALKDANALRAYGITFKREKGAIKISPGFDNERFEVHGREQNEGKIEVYKRKWRTIARGHSLLAIVHYGNR